MTQQFTAQADNHGRIVVRSGGRTYYRNPVTNRIMAEWPVPTRDPAFTSVVRRAQDESRKIRQIREAIERGIGPECAGKL
jgi:hypothetical protein